MYIGKNPLAIRSQCAIETALLELMKERTFDSLTIKEIMDNTELSRQTFYKIFDSKQEVLEYHFKKIFDEYFPGYLIHIKKETIDSICAISMLLFRFSSHHKEFISLLVQNNLISIIQYLFKKYIVENPLVDFTHESISTEAERAYAVSFIHTGIIGMIISWVEEGCTDNPDDIANLVCRITNSVTP